VNIIKNEKVRSGETTLVIPSYLKEITIDDKRTFTPEPQRGDDFMFTFADKAPLALRTIFGNNYALGVTNSGRENKTFLVFSVTTPQDATREMLRWETEMFNDLKNILQIKTIKGNIKYRDLSQNNHLFRIAEDDEGIVLVYGFGAPRTIIITTNTETFEHAYDILK
jgi:hypothetical protein